MEAAPLFLDVLLAYSIVRSLRRMTSGPCHFSSLHSHFADCLVPELPLPINLHHSPSLTSASWHQYRPLDVPLSLFVSAFSSSSLSITLCLSPLLCVSFSHSVSSCHPLLSPPLVDRYKPKSHCMSAAAEHTFQSACLQRIHIVMLLVIFGPLEGGHDLK